MLKNSKFFYFCHLKKLVRPETFGPYYLHKHLNFVVWFLLLAAGPTITLRYIMKHTIYSSQYVR